MKSSNDRKSEDFNQKEFKNDKENLAELRKLLLQDDFEKIDRILEKGSSNLDIGFYKTGIIITCPILFSRSIYLDQIDKENSRMLKSLKYKEIERINFLEYLLPFHKFNELFDALCLYNIRQNIAVRNWDAVWEIIPQLKNPNLLATYQYKFNELFDALCLYNIRQNIAVRNWDAVWEIIPQLKNPNLLSTYPYKNISFMPIELLNQAVNYDDEEKLAFAKDDSLVFRESIEFIIDTKGNIRKFSAPTVHNDANVDMLLFIKMNKLSVENYIKKLPIDNIELILQNLECASETLTSPTPTPASSPAGRFFPKPKPAIDMAELHERISELDIEAIERM